MGGFGIATKFYLFAKGSPLGELARPQAETER